MVPVTEGVLLLEGFTTMLAKTAEIVVAVVLTNVDEVGGVLRPTVL